MKKISELVDLRNQLKNIELSKTNNDFIESLTTVQKYLHAINTEIDFSPNALTQNLTELSEKTAQTNKSFDEYLSDINNFIKKNDGHLRESSKKINQASMNNADNNILEKIKDREKTHSDETIQYFSERCKVYSSWKYPGMHIRPGVGTWTRNLVDVDPLYLVDIDTALLEPVKEIFNENYVNRLRFHRISDVDNPIFNGFPENQFGFIFATEFFNQKSLGVISTYLKEIKKLLRPGGACIFTFNDCDYKEGVKNAEHNYDCYTPGNEVRDIVVDLGFEIIKTQSSNGTLFWMEIKKSGKLKSIRGGQTLAKILTR